MVGGVKSAFIPVILQHLPFNVGSAEFTHVQHISESKQRIPVSLNKNTYKGTRIEPSVSITT